MRTTLFAFLAVAALSFATVRAADEKKDEKAAGPQSVTGYLMDRECAAGILKQKDVEKAAADHTKDCAVEADCAKSGYGVIVDGKLIKFDDRGNELAKKYLKETSKEDHLKITVQGTVKADEIAVTSLVPADEPK